MYLYTAARRAADGRACVGPVLAVCGFSCESSCFSLLPLAGVFSKWLLVHVDSSVRSGHILVFQLILQVLDPMFEVVSSETTSPKPVDCRPLHRGDSRRGETRRGEPAIATEDLSLTFARGRRLSEPVFVTVVGVLTRGLPEIVPLLIAAPRCSTRCSRSSRVTSRVRNLLTVVLYAEAIRGEAGRDESNLPSPPTICRDRVAVRAPLVSPSRGIVLPALLALGSFLLR